MNICKKIKLQKLVILGSLLFFSSISLAAGAHGASEGIPVKTIIYQLINVAILFGALIYWTKDKVIQFFFNRQTSYQEAYKKTKSAREDAEKNLEDIKFRIQDLQTNKGDSIIRAQKESEVEKERLLKEAQEKALRIKKETHNTIEVEYSKAKNDIRNQLIEDSMKQARILLSKDIGAQDHQKLQSGFAAHIEEVRNENARSL
ncbi:MAG TPA: ATP synthase F0 subunit B [Pseudobdellovibrionaceae bacterium]|nr:ATP synthase F0 subunit B [Pseudobdellovibrionaceae bacterium]